MTTEEELQSQIMDLQVKVLEHETSLKFAWVALTEMQRRFDSLESFVVAVSALARTLSVVVENMRGVKEPILPIEPLIPVKPPKTHGPEIA